MPSLVESSIKHYYIDESGSSQTIFNSPNQHDLHIQFTFVMLCMQCIVFWCCVSRSIQANVFFSYSSSCMVYKVVRYLFIDIFNANIRPFHVCYH